MFEAGVFSTYFSSCEGQTVYELSHKMNLKRKLKSENLRARFLRSQDKANIET